MHPILKALALAVAVIASAPQASANDMLIDDFESAPEMRWRFFADTVMGGVSQGNVAFASEGTETYARMRGQVSTANNGGFIQMRIALKEPVPADAEGVRLVVRGNDQRYFVHLRTGGTVLPWQYYQAGFMATGDWTEVRLPLGAFKASGGMLRRTPRAKGLTSLGVVAFGRDHDADVSVREVGFY